MPSISGFVVTVGEPTLEKCLDALRNQTLPLERIEVISNIAGIHNALNKVHELVREDYFLRVDADMVLVPECVEILYSQIIKDPTIAIVSGALDDDLLGPIYGINMYRASAVKQFVFPDFIGSDAELAEYIKSNSFRNEILNQVLGSHKPYFDRGSIFQRFEREGQKAVFYNKPERLITRFYKLSEKLLDGDIRALYGIIAMSMGLTEVNLKQKNFSLYCKSDNYGKFLDLLNKMDLADFDAVIERMSAGQDRKNKPFRVRRIYDKIRDKLLKKPDR